MTTATKRKAKQRTKHAPGPWTNDYSGTTEGQACTGMGCGYGKSQIVDAKGRAIAGVAAVEPNDGPMYRDGSFSQETFDCLHATAALIAAAPELLEAARFAASVLKANRLVEMSEKMAHQKLTAAIHKAEGKDSAHA